MATAEAGTEPESGADIVVACATRALSKCSLVDCDNPRPETLAPADPAGTRVHGIAGHIPSCQYFVTRCSVSYGYC
jgi:hypothetical protein